MTCWDSKSSRGILARGMYGAKSKTARMHFNKVVNLKNNNIAILFELSYGYQLLGDKKT